MKTTIIEELQIYNNRVEHFYEQSSVYGSRETLLLIEISKTNILRLLEEDV